MVEPTNPGEIWWVKLFAQFGFSTALAILLVAAMLGWIPSPIMATLSRMEYNAWQQTSILRSICYNTDGKSGTTRNCEPWKPQSER